MTKPIKNAGIVQIKSAKIKILNTINKKEKK
jgi:hypothetical protein